MTSAAIGAANLVLPTPPSGIDEQRRLASKTPTEVAKEFEALLVAQLIGAMRKTIPESGLLDASASRRMLDGAFDTEMARAITAGQGLGIARQLAAQLEKRAQSSHPTDVAVARGEPTEGLAAYRAAAVVAGADVAAAQDATSASGTAVTPVDGRVTSEFGVRRDPITGAPKFHGGIDVAAPPGTPIHAVAEGEVVFSGRRGPAGNLVTIRHDDGTVTSYAHAARTLVAVGQKVAAGDVVATVGSSGRSTGPHVHFSVRRDGQLVDPEEFLEEAGVPPAGLALATADAEAAE